MFGLVPFERNELWNPFREFENEFFKGFGSVFPLRLIWISSLLKPGISHSSTNLTPSSLISVRQ